MLLHLLAVLGACVTSVVCNAPKERVASLIVLPPIVLGYDELYEDLNAKKPIKKEPEKPKEIKREATPAQTKGPVGFKRMNVPWDQLVAYDDPRGEDAIIIPQQRLVLKRTKDGRIVVPDEEWTVTPKDKTSRLRNVIRTLAQNETLKDSTTNKDQSGKNKTSGNAEENTKLDIDIGKEGLKKENPIVEGLGKEKPSNTNENGGKQDPSNNNDGNKDKNNKIEDMTKIEPNNKIDEEKVVAEKITNIDTPVVINKDNGNGDLTEEAPLNLLKKKRVSLPGNGVITDPLSGDILNFQGNFVLPHALFDCPCAKNKS